MEHITHLINNIDKLQIWKTISGIELIIVLILLFRINKKGKIKLSPLEQNLINDAKSETVDMGKLMDSLFKAAELHNLLKRNVHADKFAPNTEMMLIADELAAEINKNKSNYEKLVELKKSAEEKLMISL